MRQKRKRSNENSNPQMNQDLQKKSCGFVHYATSPFTPYSKKTSGIFSPGGLDTGNEKKVFDAFGLHSYLGSLRGFNEASPVLSVSNFTSPNPHSLATCAKDSIQSFGSEKKESPSYSFGDFASSPSAFFSHGFDADACITLGNEWDHSQAFDCSGLDPSEGAIDTSMSFDGLGFTPAK